MAAADERRFVEARSGPVGWFKALFPDGSYGKGNAPLNSFRFPRRAAYDRADHTDAGRVVSSARYHPGWTGTLTGGGEHVDGIRSKGRCEGPRTGPLWSMGIADGSSRRVGNLIASDARYFLDGRQIAFAAVDFSPRVSLAGVRRRIECAAAARIERPGHRPSVLVSRRQEHSIRADRQRHKEAYRVGDRLTEPACADSCPTSLATICPPSGLRMARWSSSPRSILVGAATTTLSVEAACADLTLDWRSAVQRSRPTPKRRHLLCGGQDSTRAAPASG